MKQTKILMKMSNGYLTPLYPDRYNEFLTTINDQQKVMVTFKSANEKTAEQLGYIYACVYPFMEAELKKLGHDTMYFEGVGEVRLDAKSIDKYFKKLYSMYIQREFNKTDANIEDLASYITFCDRWCIENVGFPLPAAKEKI